MRGDLCHSRAVKYPEGKVEVIFHTRELIRRLFSDCESSVVENRLEFSGELLADIS
jgi:hypothetical protein